MTLQNNLANLSFLTLLSALIFYWIGTFFKGFTYPFRSSLSVLPLKTNTNNQIGSLGSSAAHGEVGAGCSGGFLKEKFPRMFNLSKSATLPGYDAVGAMGPSEVYPLGKEKALPSALIRFPPGPFSEKRKEEGALGGAVVLCPRKRPGDNLIRREKQMVSEWNFLKKKKKNGTEENLIQNIAYICILFSNLLLSFLLIIRWKESGHLPLSNLYESLMFLSWCFTVLHLIFEKSTFTTILTNIMQLDTKKKTLDSYNQVSQQKEVYTRINIIGAITTPSALFTNAFATFTLPKEMQEVTPLVPALQSNWLMMHVTVMILSYAALILGSLLAIAFLIVTADYPIKKKNILTFGPFLKPWSFSNYGSFSNSGKNSSTVPFRASSTGLLQSSSSCPEGCLEHLATSSMSSLPFGGTTSSAKLPDREPPAPVGAALFIGLSPIKRPGPFSGRLGSFGRPSEAAPPSWSFQWPGPFSGPHPIVGGCFAAPRRPPTWGSSWGSMAAPGHRGGSRFIGLSPIKRPIVGVKGPQLWAGGPLISKDQATERTRPRPGQTKELVEVEKIKYGDTESLGLISFESGIQNLALTLDNLSYRILGIGFPFLTIGILSGAVWANEAWGSYWSWDPKETWALLTWLIFAIYFHTRIHGGSGKQSAKIATVGFIVVWICYLGVNLIGEGLHSYGMLS